MEATLIGTGLLGRAMGERLLARGHRLTVFNRTPARALPLAGHGATVAPSAAAAIASSRVTLLVLSDAAAADGVLFAGAPPPVLHDHLIVQMSTVAPNESRALAGRVAAAGGTYLEAPVLGSRPQAAQGALQVMVGGSGRDLDGCQDLLAALGEVRQVGAVGQAAALKLALNQLIAAEMSAFALSLGMARRSGLDPALFMEILRGSALYTRAFDGKLPGMLSRSFGDPNFPTRLLLKDVDLIRGEAAALGLETAAIDGVREVVAKAVAAELGDLDYSSLYQIVDPPGGR